MMIIVIDERAIDKKLADYKTEFAVPLLSAGKLSRMNEKVRGVIADPNIPWRILMATST
jgi:hypothetical protein